MNHHGSSHYFDQIAPRRDNVREGYFSNTVREVAISKAYLTSDMNVVDIGGGTGYLSAALAPLVNRVSLIDNSAEMLQSAEKNLNQFENIQYYFAEGLSIPLEDYSQDAVFANMYLHHMENPLLAIKDMVRILRPGGRIIITDLDKHSYKWMKDEMADVWLGFERSQIKKWYRLADLVNIIIDSIDQECCASSQKVSSSNDTINVAKIGIFVAVGSRRIKGVGEMVESRYGAIAENSSSCCSPQIEDETASCCKMSPEEQVIPLESLVSDQQVQIPQDVAEFSLGCGTPTQKAGMKPGEVVLDIGSGGGLDAMLASQRVGPEGKVIGVDRTAAMIERAQKNAIKAGMTNIEYRIGSADNLPIEDSSIDVVISNCVVNLCDDKGVVFDEISRVLRPGGHLQISDIVTNTTMSTKLLHNAESWAGCVSGALPEEEYVDLVRQAGLTMTSIQRSSTVLVDSGLEVYSIDLAAKKN